MKRNMTAGRYQALTGIVAFAALAVAAALATQGRAQGVPETGQDWELVAGNMSDASAGGQSQFGERAVPGQMYLYNRRTGKVYRYFPFCSSGTDESEQGCFFGIPVLDQRSGFQLRAQPTGTAPPR